MKRAQQAIGKMLEEYKNKESKTDESMVSPSKQRIICPCGKDQRKDNLKDKGASGLCNKCQRERDKGIQGQDAHGVAIIICFECGKEQRIDRIKGDNKTNLCNLHFRLHNKSLKSQVESSDVTVTKKEMIKDDDCQKGYTIELNNDNLSMASTAPYTDSSSRSTQLAVSFKLPNDNTTYYYTGPVWFAERQYHYIIEDILVQNFQYPGPLIVLPNGRIWKPLMQEIKSGMLVAQERVSHRNKFTNSTYHIDDNIYENLKAQKRIKGIMVRSMETIKDTDYRAQTDKIDGLKRSGFNSLVFMTRDNKEEIKTLLYQVWTKKRKYQEMETRQRLLKTELGLIDWAKLQQLPEVPLRMFSKEMKVKQKPIQGQPSFENISTIRVLFDIEFSKSDDNQDLLDGYLVIKSQLILKYLKVIDQEARKSQMLLNPQGLFEIINPYGEFRNQFQRAQFSLRDKIKHLRDNAIKGIIMAHIQNQATYQPETFQLIVKQDHITYKIDFQKCLEYRRSESKVYNNYINKFSLIQDEAKFLANVAMLKDISFKLLNKPEFIEFLMSFQNTYRRIQVIKGIVTKNIDIVPKFVCPISENKHLNEMMQRMYTKKQLLTHEVYVDGDCFHVEVPEDKFQNFFKVMIWHGLEPTHVPNKQSQLHDQSDSNNNIKHPSKRQQKQYEKKDLKLVNKAKAIESLLGYWKRLHWSSKKFCGGYKQQTQENRFWFETLSDLEFINVDLYNMNYIDFGTGWGRLIFKVALQLEQRFISYEGVDINESCKNKFERLAWLYCCKERNLGVKFHLKNVLDFESQKKYALITASWLLGFFKTMTIIQILQMIKNMIDTNGYIILKEQVNCRGYSPKGQDKYFRYTKRDYHRFFQDAEFKFQIIHEQSWYDEDTEWVHFPEVWWMLTLK